AFLFRQQISWLSWKGNIELRLLVMMENHVGFRIFLTDKCSGFFSTKYRAVLSAGTSKINLKMLEIPIQVIFYSDGNEVNNVPQKFRYSGLGTQKILYRKVFSG